MRRVLVVLASLALGALGPAAALDAAGKSEKRCGYLSNPTPANWWLTDRHGEWTIGVQGGYQAEGLDMLPESFFENGWVRTNGWYGYRCACLTVSTDRKEMRITRIYGGTPLPMQRCTKDRAISRVE